MNLKKIEPLAFPPLYLTGATAVGKSTLALELARLLQGEIISVDSMQVYRGLDIGTDKPSPEIRQQVRHHLVDVAKLTESFDAGRFIQLAEVAQQEIQDRQHVPIFCGGTGMYFKAKIEGLVEVPAGSKDLREELATLSLEELCKRLVHLSPETAEKIDCKNRRRVERALEIVLISGRETIAQRTQWQEINKENPLPQGNQKPFFIILQRNREELVARIHERVEKMFRRGLVEETEQLLKHGLEQNRTAMQAIGYRQVVAYLHGQYTLEETKEEIKVRTRHFSKRQGTWFRGQLPYAQWCQAAENVEAQAGEIAEHYQTYISKDKKNTLL